MKGKFLKNNRFKSSLGWFSDEHFLFFRTRTECHLIESEFKK